MFEITLIYKGGMYMISIKFRAAGQLLERMDKQNLVAFARNELYAEFETDEVWNGKEPVTAQFTNGSASYDIELEDGKCLIPWEVLQDRGILEVALFGGDLLTTNTVNVSILSTGVIGGLVPTKASPSVYRYIVDLAKSVEEKVKKVITGDFSGLTVRADAFEADKADIKEISSTIQGDTYTTENKLKFSNSGFELMSKSTKNADGSTTTNQIKTSNSKLTENLSDYELTSENNYKVTAGSKASISGGSQVDLMCGGTEVFRATGSGTRISDENSYINIEGDINLYSENDMSSDSKNCRISVNNDYNIEYGNIYRVYHSNNDENKSIKLYMGTDEAVIGVSELNGNESNSYIDSGVKISKGAMELIGNTKVNGINLIDEINGLIKNISQVKDYLGYNDDVLGLQADFENNSFKRLSAAENLIAGSDFDAFGMYGGRKRCNVADDGSIVAYYGDAEYTEDGSNGQVMVYQPKFYYKVVPVKLENTDTETGYCMRKVNYYICEKPKVGFKLHPAFYDENGNEINYVLYSAYEGCIFSEAEGRYLLDDEQGLTDLNVDKISSIANAKPVSGNPQNLSRNNIEKMAENRGSGWHGEGIKTLSANQLLMVIEMGTFNIQSALGRGVVDITDNGESNNSVVSGTTSYLGNISGQAAGENGVSAISYRGIENPYGNILKTIDGINIWGNGNMKGGQVYICSDFNYSTNNDSGNYEATGIYAPDISGYISAFGYSEKFDWLFIPVEANGNSVAPVGDYVTVGKDVNGYNIVLYGGYWSRNTMAGAFCIGLDAGMSTKHRTVGGRLVYIPENKQ